MHVANELHFLLPSFQNIVIFEHLQWQAECQSVWNPVCPYMQPPLLGWKRLHAGFTLKWLHAESLTKVLFSLEMLNYHFHVGKVFLCKC